MSHPLGLELLMSVSHLMWVPGTELRPLKEQQEFLASEAPLQLQLSFTISTTEYHKMILLCYFYI